MLTFWWRVVGLVACAGAVLAQQRMDQDAILSQRPVRVRDRVPQFKNEEPSCEELKAMWRLSKRQARAPEMVNELPAYRDPLMYNEWPVYKAVPRAAPRYRYNVQTQQRETYGRVLTKAPPNVVRTPDYDEMYGMLNPTHNSGKILRFPGPSRNRGGSNDYQKPSHKDKFETVKGIVLSEYVRERTKQQQAHQKHELKDITSGKGKASGNRQVNQFSRYSDSITSPSRRSYPPYYYDTGYESPEYYPYVY